MTNMSANHYSMRESVRWRRNIRRSPQSCFRLTAGRKSVSRAITFSSALFSLLRISATSSVKMRSAGLEERFRLFSFRFDLTPASGPFSLASCISSAFLSSFAKSSYGKETDVETDSGQSASVAKSLSGLRTCAWLGDEQSGDRIGWFAISRFIFRMSSSSSACCVYSGRYNETVDVSLL